MPDTHVATPRPKVRAMPVVSRAEPWSSPSYQAFRILHVAFIIAPILAGLDKFFDVLVPWQYYLSPLVTKTLGISASTIMPIVGVVEIAAGILVALKPSIGGWVVACWLWGIIINLLTIPGNYDIALRDFGLSLAAIALARLSVQHENRPATVRSPS